MRSNKSRSRNKSNRNRSGGNNMNRVFDSSGPEGKVRGTPQQIIEKYSQLAQDAILSNDRVAAENFQQHGEHYARLFAKAQKEIEAKREQHEQQQRERQQARSDQQRGDQNRNDQKGGAQKPGGAAPHDQQPDLAQADQPDIMPPSLSQDAGLVDTPEAAPAKKPRARRKPKPEAAASGDQPEQPDAPKAAE